MEGAHHFPSTTAAWLLGLFSLSFAVRLAHQQMILRRYRTNRWLWCAASAIVLVAIGASVRIPIKGDNVLVAWRFLEITRDLVSGREELAAVFAVLIYLAVCILVSVIVGWLLLTITA